MLKVFVENRLTFHGASGIIQIRALRTSALSKGEEPVRKTAKRLGKSPESAAQSRRYGAQAEQEKVLAREVFPKRIAKRAEAYGEREEFFGRKILPDGSKKETERLVRTRR